MSKTYGIFKISYNSCETNATEERNRQVLLVTFDDSWLYSQNGVFEDKSEAQRKAFDCRFWDRRDRRNERCIYKVYAHRFFIHECDDKGNIVYSKAEIKRAVKWYIDSTETWSEGIDSKIRAYEG